MTQADGNFADPGSSGPSYPASPMPGSAIPADPFAASEPHPGGAPPPGYVAYGSGQATPLESTAGLATAVKVLFWVSVAAGALSTLALFTRRSAWTDFVAGGAGFGDLDNADAFVGATSLFSLLLLVAGGIVLSIWSLRAARNFQALGSHDISPGWACGGWYIPIGNLFVPFIQLRRGVTSTAGDTSPITIWQTLFVGSTLAGGVVRQAFDGTGTFRSPQQVTDQLTTQSVASVVQLLFLAGAAFFAIRAINAVNATFTER